MESSLQYILLQRRLLVNKDIDFYFLMRTASATRSKPMISEIAM